MDSIKPPTFTLSLAAALGMLLGGIAPLCGYEQVAPPPKVVLPLARTPAESLAAITVPADLQVELVAAEPAVMDPIDVAWGPDGRMWVVEMADYPNGLDGHGQAGGRIRVLESTRGDGRYDKSTLFADGLNFPNSVKPWRKGVLVSAAPDILYLEDTDGDGRADLVERRFTGLREGNQQHRGNGLQWGLDGWLYLSNGDSGGTLKSARTGQVLELGRRDFRLQPDEGLADAQAGRSQFGRNRDDWGNWFGGNNSNPILHYALDERYLRRNSFLTPPNSTIMVPRIPGAAPVYPTSQTIARFNDPFGANRFTSACGTSIYRDELLGPGYAGNVFACEPVHNLVHREILEPAGVTFTSRRAPSEQTAEFLASSDNWSRFTAARTGPDGALYIVDMYRMVIEHPEWIPGEWQKQLGDLRAGSDKGRIYRVFPRGAKLRPVPRLDRADPSELVQALNNPSGTVRDLAQQQLTWAGAKAAAPALEQLVASAARPQSRVQALCTLDTIGALTPEMVVQALKDRHPGVRRQAVRLSDGFAASRPELLGVIAPLADDPDAGVRQQVAYSLGEWKAPAAGVALARLVRKNQDPFILAAAMSSALPHAETMIAQMNAEGGANRTLMEIAIATQNFKALAALLTAITGPRNPSNPTARFTLMGDLLDSLRANETSLEKLRAKADVAMKEALGRVTGLFDDARTMATNAAAPVVERVAAVELLGRGIGRQEEDFSTLSAMLAPSTPLELQLAAVKAMGQMNLAAIPERLLGGWSESRPAVRTAVIQLMISRPAWTNLLLDRLAANRAMLVQIDAASRSALMYNANPRVAVRAVQILGNESSLDRQKVIDQYLAAMSGLQGDVGRGKAIFVSSCTACHQLGDAGGRAIGPDLAGLSDRSPLYLVTHIIDPNRAIEDKYVLYSATTRDGRNLAGILTGEAGSSITLLGMDGVEQVILRNGLKSLTSTRRSLMPDGLEAAINHQGMADLVAYVASVGRAAAK